MELVVIFLVIMNILLGIGFWVHGYVVVLQYPSQVQGKVLKLEMENRISSSSCRGSLGLCSREAYYLTYEYAPMGTTDVYQQEVRVSWLYYRKFSVDQPITIRYMPHDPERSHLNEIDFIFQVLAGSAILLGIAILFAKISFRKRHRPNPV